MGQAEVRRYNRKLIAASAVYAATVVGARALVPGAGEPVRLALVAALPLIPALFMIHFAIEAVRAADELQKRRHLEALGIGFAGTAITVITFSLLDSPELQEAFGWFAVWVVMSVFWIAGHVAAYLRYR